MNVHQSAPAEQLLPKSRSQSRPVEPDTCEEAAFHQAFKVAELLTERITALQYFVESFGPTSRCCRRRCYRVATFMQSCWFVKTLLPIESANQIMERMSLPSFRGRRSPSTFASVLNDRIYSFAQRATAHRCPRPQLIFLWLLTKWWRAIERPTTTTTFSRLTNAASR